MNKRLLIKGALLVLEDKENHFNMDFSIFEPVGFDLQNPCGAQCCLIGYAALAKAKEENKIDFRSADFCALSVFGSSYILESLEWKSLFSVMLTSNREDCARRVLSYLDGDLSLCEEPETYDRIAQDKYPIGKEKLKVELEKRLEQYKDCIS